MASEDHIRKMIGRLGLVYRKPDDMKSTVAGWMHVLRDVNDHDLTRRVDEYMSSPAAYFPKPGQLKPPSSETMSRQNYGPSSDDEDRDKAMDPCPVCGAVIQLVKRPRPDGSITKRYDIIHDREAHRGVSGFFAGTMR